MWTKPSMYVSQCIEVRLKSSQDQPKRLSLGGLVSPGVKMTSKHQRHASAKSFLKVYWLLFSKSMHLKNNL